jgi:hypothetical protein
MSKSNSESNAFHKEKSRLNMLERIKDKNIFSKEAYGEINSDLVLKNPLLFSLDKAKGSINEVMRIDYDPTVLEEVRKMSLSNTLKKEDEKDKKQVKKVNFLKFLKRPRAGTSIDFGLRRGVLGGLFKNVDLFREITSHKKYEDEKVVIDNQEFFKTETDKIAQKILTKCNYFHKKSPNNNKTLKVGDGKLMMTKGLTLKEFHAKHKV